jgi:glycosyltransferase involved in cell wall biosynthesis
LNSLIEGAKTINLRGCYQHEHLGQVFSEIDVLVVPSLWHENHPLVIQEAFASKTPVIAANVGGISDAVKDEINGLLFERLDAKDLARQLRRLVDEPDLLTKLRAGIPGVRNISDEISELEEMYSDVIAAKKNKNLLPPSKS